MKKVAKSRTQKRNERAEAVCRELRYQMANQKWDARRLFDLLEPWMRVANKNKYERPALAGNCRKLASDYASRT